MEAEILTKEEKTHKPNPKGNPALQAKTEERVVRILSTDIEGGMKVDVGLTKIKGVSWGLSNAICKKLEINKKKKIGMLTENEIGKIVDSIKNPTIPFYLLNRQKDPETGKDRHLVGTDLELRRDFDIKRLKQIKSYRGIRHMAGQPVRGQRTKSHFRSNRRKGSGIKSKGKKTGVVR